MIEIHWFWLYAIVAWTWAATCWACEAAEDKHDLDTDESIGAFLSAPIYFWLVLLVIAAEALIELKRRRD